MSARVDIGMTPNRRRLLAELQRGYDSLVQCTGLSERTLRNIANGHVSADRLPMSTAYALLDACGFPLDGWR